MAARKNPLRSVSMGPRDTRNTMGRGSKKLVKIAAPKKAAKSGAGGGG